MRKSSAIWVTIHMARSEEAARSIVELLTGEGVLARSKPVYKNPARAENLYEVQVLHSEAKEATELLLQSGYLN